MRMTQLSLLSRTAAKAVVSCERRVTAIVCECRLLAKSADVTLQSLEPVRDWGQLEIQLDYHCHFIYQDFREAYRVHRVRSWGLADDTSVMIHDTTSAALPIVTQTRLDTIFCPLSPILFISALIIHIWPDTAV